MCSVSYDGVEGKARFTLKLQLRFRTIRINTGSCIKQSNVKVVLSWLILHTDVSSPLPAFCCHQVLTVDAVLLCFSPFMWVMHVVNGPQAVFLLAQTVPGAAFTFIQTWDRTDLLIHRCWVCISSWFVALCTSYHHKGVQLSLGWFQ